MRHENLSDTIGSTTIHYRTQGFKSLAMGLLAGALAGLGLLAPTRVAADENPFPGLVGSWSGTGEIRLEGGKTERMQCRAYYRGEGAGGLGLAIRCANPSAKIDLRARLNNASGSVTGNWEERTFNAGGSVSGKATASKVDLSIGGGGLNATMNVAISGSSHSVNISTEGIAMKGVKISMARN